jgi:two-component system chemotaxis response regulator CheB
MSAQDDGVKVRVLVVEDSPSVRELLVYILGSDPEVAIIGTADNGEDAIEAARDSRPDVITMDVRMPKMDGLEATRRIMEICPTPIVIVSGSSARDEMAATFRALEAGALAFVAKPNGVDHPLHGGAARHLLETVKLMSEVRVVRRWPKRQAPSAPAPAPPEVEDAWTAAAPIELVAIGASTGGPVVLRTILSALPRNLPVPILVVQHIAAGFTEGFAEWLTQSSGMAVRVAADGERPSPGIAYVAPDGSHMKVERGGRIALSHDRPENGHRPSVSYLFRSVAAVAGARAIGVLLTGMGRDGAEELKLMKDKGAVTIAQDHESSLIHGMPGEAIGLGAATYVLSADRIAAALAGLVEQGSSSAAARSAKHRER